MNIWNQGPIVRLILPFLAGILSAIYLPSNTNFFSGLIAASLITIFSVLFVLKIRINYKTSWWFGAIVLVCLFALGYELTRSKTLRLQSGYFEKMLYGDKQYMLVHLSEPLQEKERSYKTVVEIDRVRSEKEWKNVCGRMILYLKKDSSSSQLHYGDELLIRVHPDQIPPPQNPYQFNYRQYLSFHNIHHQAFLKKNDWVRTGNNSGNGIVALSVSWRDKLLEILRALHVTGDEYAVGAALMVGYEDKLDADIISAYSSTGALHVLSVSGLHVGIIFIVFNWLLLFFDKMKYGNVLKASVLILLLWLYAALTGLSPSVLRAAAMFSFIVIAKSFSYYTNIYNTLAASALVLLIYDPYLIMEVGFQLSYLAVFGIVFIQPKIYDWFYFDNRILDNVWSVTSVSLAAQLATFPLGLHYFHQFPNYFLISNLIVIPVSTIIIYLGIVLFCISKIPLFAKYLAIAFVFLLWFLNYSVKFIDKMPYALLDGISISVVETWFIYGGVLFLLYYFIQRKYFYLMATLYVCVFLLLYQSVEQQKELTQRKIIVYNVPKTSAVDLIDAKTSFLLADTVFLKNESALLFNVKHNWWALGVEKCEKASTCFKNKHLRIDKHAIQFFDKTIVLIADNRFESKVKSFTPVQVDLLIFSKNTKMKLEDVLKLYHPRIVIFDSSNSSYKVKKWKEECIKLHQQCYSVMDSGAFEIDV